MKVRKKITVLGIILGVLVAVSYWAHKVVDRQLKLEIEKNTRAQGGTPYVS